LLDLRLAPPGAQATATRPWLIEINTRPPGFTATQVIESTYGIDYWGIALLLAVSDKARARALSRPFANGPQYFSVMVFITADYDRHSCEGIFDSDDIYEELLAGGRI
jgi:hypothetical protein